MDYTEETYHGQFTVEERKAMTAQVLRELRKNKKLSQKEVAAYLNIPATTYNTYESGRTEPPIEILVRLSHWYEVSVDFIVQRDRTYRTAEDVAKMLEEYKAQLTELDKQIAEQGETSPTLLAFRDTLEQMVDALISCTQKAEVKQALDETARK